MATNTRRAYARQWAAFTAWCDRHGRASLPATAEALAEDGKGPASIEQAVAAIRTAHRTAGHGAVPDTRGARLVLRSHRRERAEAGKRSRQARSSKTDQDALGAVVAIPRGGHAETDPVRLFQAWRAVLADHGINGGRVFRSVTRHGRIGASMSTDAVSDTVHAAAVRAGLPNADTYSAHSLRAGGATSAYKAGAPVSVIAAHGRWSPRAR